MNIPVRMDERQPAFGHAVCHAGDYPKHMRILIEKVLKLLEISRNSGRFQLLSLSHLACASIGFGYDGLS